MLSHRLSGLYPELKDGPDFSSRGTFLSPICSNVVIGQGRKRIRRLLCVSQL